MGILGNFLFQMVVILENFVVVLTLCRHVEEHDGDWRDGRYTGEYQRRSPPTHECAPWLRNFETAFASGAYGIWILVHLVGIWIMNTNRTDRVFGNTWDSVYEENWVKKP